jgi:hypothetical protein
VHDSSYSSDIIDINGHTGTTIDGVQYPDGYFGFRLMGGTGALSTRALPSSYDVQDFTFERNGYLFLDSDSGVLVQFSIDSIVGTDVPPPPPTPTCIKKNGKPFKNCPPPRR